MLANEPASNNVQDNTEMRDQQTVSYINNARATNNTLLNTKEAANLEAEIMVGKDRAKRLLIQDTEDPNVEAVATRQQIVEFAHMLDGDAMPVASLDNHRIHRKVLAGKMMPVLEAIPQTPTPEIIDGLKLCLSHYQEHVMMDQETEDTVKQQEMEQLKIMADEITQIEQGMLKAAAEAKIAPGAAPIPQQGGQPAATPPSVSEDRAALQEDIRTGADITLRSREADQRDRELAIKEQDSAHKKEVDLLDRAIDATKLLQEEAKRTQQAGIEEANVQLAQTQTQQ